MKRLLAVFLALVMALLPVSSLAVELPGLDRDSILSKEDLEAFFDPDQHKEFWEELEQAWENQGGSWDDWEISWGDLETLLGDLDISVEDILNLWDLYEDLDPTRWYWNAVKKI